MKKLFKYMFVGLMGCATLSSCLDDALETSPTDSMSGEGLLSNANSALVPLNGIYRSMYTAFSTSANTHQCFGISAYNLMADVMGEDLIMNDMGSGWFWYDALYQVKDRYSSTAWRSYDLWNAYYTWVSNANYILAAAETMEGAQADVNYVIGQAYAIRAYSYFMLAQSFARTYKGHESEPCCPIYTEPTVAGTQGNPRSSVEDVYKQIVSDINKAVELLNGTKQQHISHISYAVALGFQARIALVMEDWATAKTAAHAAITASGCRVLAPSQFAGLNDSGAANVMWGAEIIADQSGMYASFFSHMDQDGTGYANGGAYKEINKVLYDGMSQNDTRRKWWLPDDSRNEDLGYMQNKFRFADTQTWTGDYIWMRVEEMYLTAAEAECRLGEEAAAKEDLSAVMSQRVEGYTCTKTGTALGKLTSDVTGSLLEEIITQRRIELWGEGFRFLDLKRLHMPLDRGPKTREELGYSNDPWNNDNVMPTNVDPEASNYNMYDGHPMGEENRYRDADHKEWQWLFPQDEIDVNPLCEQNPL